MSAVLKEARRLYKMGFAILWIHEKSKRPVESGWTTGERKPWVYLESTYREGFNVGVRTGTPSRISGGYLACIDVDVKDPACEKEALAALAKLLGKKTLPEVRSGGGNGSRHLYCITDKPFKMITVAKHSGWEICVYSDGRQMVLPPSVHPSGRGYKWHRELIGAHSLLTMEFAVPEETKLRGLKAGPVVIDDADDFRETKGPGSEAGSEATKALQFEVKPVDLDWLPISKKVLEGIKNGTNVTDRSGYLLVASSALISAGLDTNEVLTVLTDPSLFMGACAYDHAKTKNRNRAAEWVYRYTVRKVSSQRSAVSAFEGVEKEVSRKLSGDELEAQNEELSEGTWKSSEHGFYYREGKKRIPDYDALMVAFEEEQPFKTIADMKSVYVFNGTHYVDCTPIEIKSFSEKNFWPRPEERTRSEFYSKILANRVARRNFFTDTTEGKVNFKNGVLDLNVSSTDLLDHTPDFGFRGVLPYDFDPFATCPVFKEWLHGIMLGDPELIAILQEFMGYVVRGGDYRYHKALWLGGVGRNGKSTFVDLLKALIGSGNFSVLSIRALMNDKFAGADLDGKIANFSEETSPQELADSGPFKNLTGDGDIFAQKKYGDPYSFRNRAKLIMTYNTIPDLKDLSPGMLSRPLIIPFLKVIKDGEQDRNIKKKLFAELSGIFNFALDGWRRLEEQESFTESEVSKHALQKIKEESCGVYQWVENNIEFIEESYGVNKLAVEPGDESTYRPRDLYAIYCRQERFQFKAPEFYRRLNSHPQIAIRKRTTRNGKVYFNLRVG